MILIVDSGSTKCDWLPVDKHGNQLFEKQRTKGMNPDILDAEELEATIHQSDMLINESDKVSAIHFYGAGCGSIKSRALFQGVS